MDDLDIRILRELTQANGVVPARPSLRTSYRNIARATRASPGTIRNRIQRMVASGVLTGSSVYANPNLLGLGAGAYAFEASSRRRKQEAVERLRAIGEILFVQNFRGSLLGTAFVYENEAARTQTISRMHQATGATRGIFSRVIYPPCDLELSPSEWRMVSRLMRDGFPSYSALARDLHTSVRTVKRRVAKLVDSHAILSVPTMDYRALTGCVPADLIVSFASPSDRPEAEREILRLVSDRMIFAGIWQDFGMYSLILPKVSTASQVADHVTRLPGVAMARIELVEEHIDQARGLLKYVERRGVAAHAQPLPAVPAYAGPRPYVL